jgi:CheY-like chemotaxis protein
MISKSSTNETTISEQKECIMVVEDDEDMRQMLGQLLEREGYRVIFAGDGQTALTQAKQHYPDLILMDLALPDVSGWDAVKLLRKMPAFQGTPIIAVTAHVSILDQRRAMEAGCSSHLGKPFKTRLLLQSIMNLLENGGNAHET